MTAQINVSPQRKDSETRKRIRIIGILCDTLLVAIAVFVFRHERLGNCPSMRLYLESREQELTSSLFERNGWCSSMGIRSRFDSEPSAEESVPYTT